MASGTQQLIQSRWPWLAASLILTVSLFVATTLGWLWYADQRDSAARELSLDLLWLEQNVTQTLNDNQRLLENWSHDLQTPGSTGDFLALADGLMKENPALIAIDYLDKNGRRVAGLPAYHDRPVRLPPVSDPFVSDAIRRAYSLKKPAYSRVIEQYAPLWVLVVPIADDPSGVVLATYDLDQLLSERVPWWFVQRYDLSLIDRDNKQLSPRDGLTTELSSEVHKLNFGPDNSGLSLRASPHARLHSEGPLLWLSLAVVAFGVLIIWLLRLLQRWLRERQTAQQALAHELHFREAMEQSLVTGLLAFDRDGRIIYVNPALCQMLGLSSQQLIGACAPFVFWPPEHANECQAAHTAMLHGDNPELGRTLNLLDADQCRLSVRLFASPLIGDNSTPNGWMASLYDISAERQAANTARERDELLQHTARLANLAEFASGIAHELNQPLAAIANYSAAADAFLHASPMQTAKVEEAVQRMGDESRRAGKIIHSLRSFIQKRAIRHELRDLTTLLTEPLALLAPLSARLQVAIEVNCADSPVWVECDAVMIEQVIFNLLRNAIEAVAACPGEHAPVQLTITPDQANVILSVTDHGPGIADPDKLFLPFYTTKTEGMGLGLAICRTVIESHGGRLWHQPNPVGGACFQFRLQRLTSEML